MYKLCKTEQSAARQRELEQGLLQMMRAKQYEDISISDLCDQLQVPRKSFYRYFSNKDGALFALLDHTLLEFEQSPSSSKDHRSGAIGDLERFFVFWYERQNLLMALQRSRLGGLLVERATSHALHERMMPRYLLNEPKKVQQMSLAFAICGLLSMVLLWHNEGYQESPRQMAKTATMMLTMPLVQSAQ